MLIIGDDFDEFLTKECIVSNVLMSFLSIDLFLSLDSFFSENYTIRLFEIQKNPRHILILPFFDIKDIIFLYLTNFKKTISLISILFLIQ